MVRQLIYISASPDRDAPRGIEDILATSRRNNEREGVTGLLVFTDGSFFQVLEGDAAVLERRFLTIRNDRRHSFVTLLADREIAARMFPDWAMAWRDCPPDHPISSRIRSLAACADLAEAAIDPVLAVLIAPSLKATER